jgi:RNA polymerase sigma-70 factor, ECF subfamily
LGDLPSAGRATQTQPNAELDDSSLIRAVVAGEEGAAAAVWERYAHVVSGLVRRSLRTREGREDVVHDICLQVLSSVARLKNPLALRSFIYSVSVRRLRLEFRRRSLQRLFPLADDSDAELEASAPAVDSEGRELLARLYDLLDVLSVEDRLVFILRFIDGLKMEDVARRTGASLATAKRRARRAYARVSELAGQDADLVGYLNRRKIGERSPQKR